MAKLWKNKTKRFCRLLLKLAIIRNQKDSGTSLWRLLLKWIVYRSTWLLSVPSKRTCHFLSISFHATCMGKTSRRMQHAVQQRNRKQVENEISEDRNYHRRRNRSSRVTFPFHPQQNSLCFQRSFDSCLDSKGLRGWRRKVIHYVRMWYDLPKATNTFARDTKPNVSFLFVSFSDVKETVKVKTIATPSPLPPPSLLRFTPESLTILFFLYLACYQNTIYTLIRAAARKFANARLYLLKCNLIIELRTKRPETILSFIKAVIEYYDRVTLIKKPVSVT